MRHALGILLVAGAALASVGAQTAPADQRPWRLDDLIGDIPWLKLSGRQRTRFESLHGQFRAGPRPDTEDQWFTRTSLRADIDAAAVGATIEIMDSRAFDGGSGDDRFVDTGTVNASDFVQAHARFDLGALGDGRQRLLAGRYTMSLGSRRFVIRNVFRNTVNNFTGLDYEWRNQQGETVRVFWTMPVRRRPDDAASLRDNAFEWDDQDDDLQFYGAFATRRLDERTTLDAYVFGLHEAAAGALDRRLFTPGIRLLRAPQRGDWFAELEGVLQFGESGLSAAGPKLDHLAWFAHASIGYRFDLPWQPTLRLAYDHASGDRDPNDGVNNRFDRLFGAPPFELGPTGLWGAMQRSNLSSPELRLVLLPTPTTRLLVAYRDFRLASARDEWVGAGVVDSSGAAGDRVGQQVETRARWQVIPDNLFVEIGGAMLFGGGFLERAPNSQGRDSRYGYAEMTWTL